MEDYQVKEILAKLETIEGLINKVHTESTVIWDTRCEEGKTPQHEMAKIIGKYSALAIITRGEVNAVKSTLKIYTS
jgi:hypothetical protein